MRGRKRGGKGGGKYAASVLKGRAEEEKECRQKKQAEGRVGREGTVGIKKR